MSDRHTASPHGDLEDTSRTSQGDVQGNALSGLDQMREALPTARSGSPATAPPRRPTVAEMMARAKAARQRDQEAAAANNPKRNRSDSGDGGPASKRQLEEKMQVDIPTKFTFPFREFEASSKRCFVQVGTGAPTGAQVIPPSGRPLPRMKADWDARIAEMQAAVDARKEAAGQEEAKKARVMKRARATSVETTLESKEMSRRMSEKESDNEPLTKKICSLPQVECFPQTRCFLRVNGSPVVGNIANQNGWKVFMRLDGRLDDPSITLTFRCNISRQHMSHPVGGEGHTPIDTDEVVLRFRPGGRSHYYPDHKRLEQYQSFDLATCNDQTIMLSGIVQSVTPPQLLNAMAFSFQCWHAGYNEIPDLTKWAKYRQSGIMEVFKELWLGYPFDVTIWISRRLNEGQKLGRERFRIACEEHIEDESKS